MEYKFSWQKQYLEIEEKVLEGETCEVRALYYFLRARSPGLECEPVEGLSQKPLCKSLRIGKDKLTESFNRLAELRLIEMIKAPKKNRPYKIQFCFDYEGSTIDIVKGQVVIHNANKKYHSIDDIYNGKVDPSRSTVDPSRSTTDLDRSTFGVPSLYREIEEKHIDASLKNQISKKLDDLGIYSKIYTKVISTPLGVRFVARVLEANPRASGAEVRIKIKDPVNLAKFKVIDMFECEGAAIPSGTIMHNPKTNEHGKWEWSGRSGCMRLEGAMDTVVPIKTLEALRKWEQTNEIEMKGEQHEIDNRNNLNDIINSSQRKIG